MAEKSTFIKLDRNIQEWRWFKDGNTFRVFIYLLLNANVKKNGFKGIDINRGQLATSHKSIAEKLGLTEMQVRVAIKHLKLTGEITSQIHHDFSLYTVVNYELYQGTITGNITGKQQASNKQITSKQQRYKNVKNEKNERSSSTPPQLFEISSFCSENGLNVNAEKFYDYYSGNGWKTSQGKPITDWKALLKKWSETEREQQAVVKKRNNNTLSGLPLLGSDDDDD